MTVTMKDLFDASFSHDPMVRDSVPELERMFLLESKLSSAELSLTIASANLSVATLENQFREHRETYLESIELLQELLARTSNLNTL